MYQDRGPLTYSNGSQLFVPNSSIVWELVMGGIENFLSRLLKDKIPRYHGILPYSDFYIFINILLRNLQNLSTFRVSCNYWVMENICLSNKLSNFANVLWLLVTVLIVKFQIHKPYWCVNLQWKFKEIVTWNLLKITFIMYHNCCTY